MPGKAIDSAVAPPAAAPTAGVLVVVLGAKGGCGATTTAVNLAGNLASEHRTLLVDLDLCKGDVAGALDLPTGRSMALLLERMDDVDEALLDGAIEQHPSGMAVLAQPYDLSELHTISADEVRALLRLVRACYEMVVVDAGSRIDVASLSAALAADEIILLATPDVPALRDAQRVLRLLHRIGVAPSHIRLVLNKAGHGPVSEADVAAQLMVPVVASIPRDNTACRRSDATGRLLSHEAPRAAITEAFGRLWRQLRDDDGDLPTGSRWFWSRR